MCVFPHSDNTGSINWYSPSRRPLRRQPETPFSNRYDDYDYACAYGDRLPAPSPVYSRQGYVRRSSPSNQCDWYARGDGDGRFDPDRFHDNGLQAPDGRSPYRQYDSSVNRSRDPPKYYDDDGGSAGNRGYDQGHYERKKIRRYDDGDFENRSRDPLGSYYGEDVPVGYSGTKTSRLSDGPARRNGGIGFDWTAADLSLIHI